MSEKVNMKKWQEIWSKKKADKQLLTSGDVESVFMELKRVDGNDTLGDGMGYESFKKQYEFMLRNFKGDRDEIKSVFEAGCGSGPFLLLLEQDGYRVGGMDYSQPHIEAASEVLDNPDEIYCDEAICMKTDIKYDCVFTNSMFEYFKDYGYAAEVLNKMYEKSQYCVAVLDVHDLSKETAYLENKRSIIPDYDIKYEGLQKQFYDKQFFVDFAAEHGMDIKITGSKLEGYWNKQFVFDVYMYKNV